MLEMAHSRCHKTTNFVTALALRPFIFVPFIMFGTVSAQENFNEANKTVGNESILPPYSHNTIKSELETGHVEQGSVDRGSSARRIYIFTPPANTAVQIDVRSRTIDSVIDIYEEGSTTPFLTADGGGELQDARVIIPKGIYENALVVVIRDDNALGGPFEISSLEIDQASTPNSPRLTIDRPPESGMLDINSPLVSGLEQPYTQYMFTGTAGQRVQIDAQSSAFHPIIQLRLNNSLIGQDSDSGIGTDARLIRYLKASGDYSVLVISREKELGPFSIQVRGLLNPWPRSQTHSGLKIRL
jgi:hypothetical protein